MTVKDRVIVVRMACYCRGLSDTAIAKLQDVTPGAVMGWRKRLGLQSNERAGGNRNPWGRAGKPA